jgi:hypothetical protein
MGASMSSRLIILLLQLAISKKTIFLRVKYLILGILFYSFLIKDNSFSSLDSGMNSNSEAGDDIYPLF